ncbi:hypothetical protein GALMADRAFT_231959 [Galerina marginata CBS 339.88]|uniref:Uncharacterized protein n=1 Tax=Galerina marginata (strain CBS 339.88) TaxID=685588 RepID=A0A067S9F2_GALM3|nr:hypothetical protein GALMADRAFT_231959 [Galerina marginata CBS 339.88]
MSSILDVGKGFPSISDLSNSFLITTARLGWGKKGIKLVRLGIDIKEWNALPGKLVITDLSCDIYATLPAESKQFSLWGSGAIQIGNVDLQILYSIVGKQHVTFQLQTLESPLTLKSIFGHFLEDGDAVLPEGLVSVLEETGIESLIVEGSHDGSGWSLSRFALAVGISTQVKLSDKFQLLYPRLAVDVAYPFTKAKRKIDATISATIEIAGTPCDTSVTWAGASSSLTVTFEPRGKPLLLGALVSLFIPDANTLSIPPSLEFLTGIGLADAKLIFSSSNDGFKLNEVSALVVSSTSLQLWAGLELSGLKLYFHYSNVPGNEVKAVTFGATFLIAKANLDFTISYNGPGSKSISSQSSPTTEPDDKVAASNSGTWAATTTYTGTISVLNIMSSISGIDISSELSSIGLPALRDLMDINLSDLKLALARASDETSFTFDAHVKYLFFDGPVHLTCSKSTTWEYSFAFGLSSEEFLSSLGIDGISLINSSVSLSNAPVTGNLLVNTVSNNGLNLAFTGTLVFTGQLKQLANVTGNPSLTITGSVSSKSIMLAAAASKIPLFNGMSLTGTLFFSYSTDSKQLTAAIDGTVSDIYFPEVSSEKFTASCSLFVKLPNPEVGFQFALDKLENAFGVKGLHFKDILLRAAFQEFPVPSEVLVAGKLSFRAGNQQFYGSVAIYYSEVDISHCGTMGKFETYPSLNQALKGFDSAGRTAPKAVNGTFADLEFSRALQEVRVGNIVIPQGFIMKGSLKLPSIGLDMWFDIEFTPAHIRIAGDIKNAITITVNNNRLFALTRASDRNRGPTMDLTIDTHSPPKCYSSGEIYLLGLSASAQFEMTDSGIEFHETISAWMSGFKIDFAIDYTYYLDLAATCILKLDIPSFKCGVVTIPRMDAVKFSASLATKVYWDPITWNLSIAGTMNLGKWNLGEIGPFNLGADLSDFGKVANYLVNQIKDGIAALISDKVLGGLKKGLKVAVDELKAAGLLAKNTAELLVKEFKQDIDEVTKQVGEVFELGKEEMAKIMKELGSTAEQIGRFFKDTYSVAAKNITQILKQVGYAVEDVGRTLKNVYGIAANEVSDILKQAGYAADDVGRTLKDVYGVASKEVATLLKQAGYAVDDVGRALKDVFGATETEVADLLKQAGYAVDDVGKALKDVFGATESQVTSILKQLGYSADDVGRALKDVYGATSKEVGALLKGAGYALDEVTRTLQNVFSVSAESAASILRDIGYAADDVAKTLKNVFDVTGQQASQMLQAAGYAMQDVNKAIGDIFGTIGDIGNTIGDTIGDIGNTIGGGAKDVGDTIGDIGNTIGDGAKDVGKTIGGWFGL